MDLRLSQRRRFAEILNHVREKRHLSLTELATLLHRPKSTVAMWAKAKRLPPKKDLPVLCSRLNVNHEALLMKNPVADAYFDDQVVGYEALQLRYLDVRMHDEYRALYLSNLAGFLLHAQLMLAGFAGSVTSSHELKCVLTLNQPDCYISIDCLGEHGIGFTVYSKSRERMYPWHLLNKTNLDLLVQFLHSLCPSR